MNILHNVEAVFALAVGVAVGAGAMLPNADTGAVGAITSPVHEVMLATPTQQAVIQVSARKLSAVEKMRSLENERALARAEVAPRG